MDTLEFLLNIDNFSDEQLMTEKHLAAMLQISLSKIQKDRVKGGGIPIRKIGNSVRYQLGDVRQYLKATKHLSTSSYEINLAYEYNPAEFVDKQNSPYAIKCGVLKGFLETLDEDVDDIIWLTEEEALAFNTNLA